MSSFDRRTLLTLPLVALAACGFTPVYGPGGSGGALHGKVMVAAPDTPDGYFLVRRLEDRLGRAQAPAYDLDLTLALISQGQVITESDEKTRYSIVGTLGYTLTSRATGTVAASGDLTHFTGYSATGSTVETLAAERDARQRLMVILADQLAATLYSTADTGE